MRSSGTQIRLITGCKSSGCVQLGDIFWWQWWNMLYYLCTM